MSGISYTHAVLVDYRGKTWSNIYNLHAIYMFFTKQEIFSRHPLNYIIAAYTSK